MDKRDGGWGGGYHDSPSEAFCRTVPKTFVAEPFCAVFQKFYGSVKVYCFLFLSKFFCFKSPKNFVRNSLVFHFFGHRKNAGIREGGHHDFPTKFFFSQY